MDAKCGAGRYLRLVIGIGLINSEPTPPRAQAGDAARWALAVAASGLVVFASCITANTLVRASGILDIGWRNAATATFWFYTVAPFMAIYIYLRGWRRLETFMLGGLALYLPMVFGTGAASVLTYPGGGSPDDHVSLTFVRVVKNIPALVGATATFWVLVRDRIPSAHRPVASSHDLNVEIAPIIRREGLEQAWLWSVVSLNIAVGMVLILMAAGLSARALMQFCAVAAVTTSTALLLRMVLLRLPLDNSRLDYGLALFDGLMALGWGSLAWFLPGGGDPRVAALILATLTAAAATMNMLSSRRMAPPVLSVCGLFLPFIAVQFALQGSRWQLFIVAAVVAVAMSLAAGEALRRLRLKEVRLSVELERVNADLLAASRQIEREYAMRERLLRSLGHDLRQPVSALNLFLHRLDTVEDPARRREALAQSRRCVTSANDVLESLSQLAWSTGEIAIGPPRRTILRPVFQQMIDEHAATAQAKGVRLAHRGGRHAILTDPHAFERILRNIVSNAVRITEKGSVLLTARSKAGWVEIVVFDTGPGLSTRELSSVFDEFYQTGGENAPTSGVMGVGLFIVSQLTQALGGRLIARSTLGKGSAFGVALPRAASGVDHQASSTGPADELDAV